MPEAWLCPKNHVMLFPTDCEKWATHNPDASNEKTANPEYSAEDYQALKDVLAYATVSYTHLDVYTRQG